MLRVVLTHKVIQDCKCFHDGEAALVVIDDDRNAAVRTNLDKPRLLLIVVLEYVNVLICIFVSISRFELFE